MNYKKEIEIELKHKFDPKDTGSYDIDSLDVEVTLDLHEELIVEDVTFQIARQEVNFFSYEDESDIDAFDIYLMKSDDKFGQHQAILDQTITLPMTLNNQKKLDFSIPIFSSPDGHQNFLDVIKQAPDHILDDERELDLHITFYLNPDKSNEKYDYGIFKIANPFFGS
ncbi:hypothetical protein [Chryseobacterium sp. 2987]|uniref:hypothetical protein n=1 Tax=Chryseobacterium sp. 2987 TaxID=2817767 RepID=UPI002864F3FE|nr:hypothetical protein [Chryseobacterium sp. 2987]MDR6919737.1 hypothetical protein [Chryseobacterium sp. 2987]